MYGWTVLIIVFLGIVTLRAIAAKALPRPQKPKWLNILLIVLLAAGGYLLVNSSERLTQALARKSWPSAMGRVIKSEAETGKIIRPMVIYAYEVDSRAYIDTTDLQVPGFGNKNKQYEVTHAMVTEFPTGKEILVHYDPKDISNSVIVTTPRWNVYGQIGLGIVLFAGSLFFLILPSPGITVRES
jgi:hypothetical protein